MNRRRMPRLALIALTVIGLALLGAPPASAAAGPRVSAASPTDGAADSDPSDLVWSVHPSDNTVGTGRPNFGYRADPGASVQDSLDVTNRGETTLTLTVTAADAFTPRGGGIDLLRDDERSTDVGTWIALGTSSITIRPQQTATVPFTLTVPANATPGDHAGGIVTTYATGSGAFAVERRLGSRVLVRVSGDLAPRLTVSDVSVDYGTRFNPFSPATATVRYTVANTGNIRLDAHPAVTVHGPFGMLGRTVSTEDLGELLPGSSRDFTVAVPATWVFFALTAEVTLHPFPSNPNDSAADLALEAASAGTTVFALNWGQLILAAAIALLVIAGLWWRRRRARRLRAAIDDAVEKALADAAPATRGHADAAS